MAGNSYIYAMNSFIDRILVQAYFLPLRFDHKITRKKSLYRPSGCITYSRANMGKGLLSPCVKKSSYHPYC